jgi:hypothetical protein
MVPAIHDEAATFYHFVAFGKLFPGYTAQWLANNHILNSILAFFTQGLHVNKLFALRIPNLLSFLIYVFFLGKSAFRIRNLSMRWSLILSMLLVNGYLEFFGLARGYGLMLAFLMASFWFFTLYFDKSEFNPRIKFFIFSYLAIYSNFTAAFPILAMICVLVYFDLTDARRKSKILLQYLIFLIPFYPAIHMLKTLKGKGLLWYGGVVGFVHDSVLTLQDLIFGFDHIMLTILIITLTLLTICILIFKLIQKGKYAVGTNTCLTVTFILVLIGINIAHYIFDVKFPEDRTGLYLYPLFILSFFKITELVNYNKLKFLFSIVLISALAINMNLSANFTHSTFWKNERIPASFYHEIVKQQKQTDQKLMLGGYVIRELCLAYYNFEKKEDIPLVDFFDYPNTHCDLQIVNTMDTSIWDEKYFSIKYDSISNLSLLKRKKLLDRNLIANLYDTLSIEFSSEYKDLVNWEINDDQKHPICFEFSTKIFTRSNLRLWFVLEIKNEVGEKILYRKTATNWKRRSWNGETFNEILSISQLPEGSHLVNIYIWNMDKTNVNLKDINVNVQLLN